MTDVVVTGRGRRLVGRRGRRRRSSTRCSRKRSGIADGIGACADFDPEAAMTPKEARRSRPLHAARGRRGRRRRPRRPGCPTASTPSASASLVGTGVGGLITLENECADVARGRRPRRLAALRADDDAQRRRRRDRDAPRRPRPGLQRLERVRDRRARDRRGHADDRARRGRRRRRRRHRGRADRRCAWPPSGAWARCRARASRARSTPTATASSWARAPACSCSSARSTPRRAARRSTARIAGYGASNDAFHITQPDEDGRGATQAMRATLARTPSAAPADVGYVNAHGTVDAVQRPDRDARDQAGLQRLATPPPVSLDEVADRPPARRRRRRRGDRVPRGGAPRRPAADAQLRARPTPSATSTTCPRGPREAPGSSWRCRTRSDSAARTPAWRWQGMSVHPATRAAVPRTELA